MYNFIDWLRHSWRPIMGAVLTASIFLYLICGWFINIVFGIPPIELPNGIWETIVALSTTLFAGRSLEHFGKNWQSKNNDQEMS